MKKPLIILLLISLSLSLHASMDVKELLQEKCSSCHMIDSSTKVKQAKISAPPMWGVMRKVSEKYSNREEGIAFIIDYVKNPSVDKMVFPKATKEYFGLMPSLSNEMTDEELTAIVKYLYRDL